MNSGTLKVSKLQWKRFWECTSYVSALTHFGLSRLTQMIEHCQEHGIKLPFTVPVDGKRQRRSPTTSSKKSKGMKRVTHRKKKVTSSDALPEPTVEPQVVPTMDKQVDDGYYDYLRDLHDGLSNVNDVPLNKMPPCGTDFDDVPLDNMSQC